MVIIEGEEFKLVNVCAGAVTDVLDIRQGHSKFYERDQLGYQYDRVLITSRCNHK